MDACRDSARSTRPCHCLRRRVRLSALRCPMHANIVRSPGAPRRTSAQRLPAARPSGRSSGPWRSASPAHLCGASIASAPTTRPTPPRRPRPAHRRRQRPRLDLDRRVRPRGGARPPRRAPRVRRPHGRPPSCKLGSASRLRTILTGAHEYVMSHGRRRSPYMELPATLDPDTRSLSGPRTRHPGGIMHRCCPASLQSSCS